MYTTPTSSPSSTPVSQNSDQARVLFRESEKLHFALKTVGILSSMLPDAVLESIREKVNLLIIDEGSGRYRMEMHNVQSLRALMREKLNLPANP